MTNAYHVPVLLDASIEALRLGDGSGAWMDATFGGGGHSRVILENLNEKGVLFGFDQDPDAVANTLDDKRFTLVEANFRYAKQFLSLHGVEIRTESWLTLVFLLINLIPQREVSHFEWMDR